jgi:citrate synthase
MGALDGPLHGAANCEAMKMLLEVGDDSNVEHYVQGALAAKRKIMGFGHRVYKARDPRAVFLRGVLSNLDGRIPNDHWCKLADRVQQTVFKTKALYPNVDFYGGPALYGLGFPMEAFTGFFACARSAGWSAHALEQYHDNRLIRPASAYVGSENREYVPVAER